MLNLFLSSLAFAMVYLFASPQGMAFWWGHLVLAIFSLANLNNLSKYYFFWIYLLITSIFASEPRFSFEYCLIASSCIGFALSPWWCKKSKKERQDILVIIFVLLYIFNLRGLIFSERGSLLLWFPVFLTLYFNEINREAYLSRIISGIALSISNKKTIILAYLTSLVKFCKPKYLIVIGISILSFSFIFVEKLSVFIGKSLLPRILIWSSAIKGWISQPLFGHGFSCFAINFGPFRAHSEIHGAHSHQQISHGHNLLVHFLFEQGLVGLALCILIFYLVYKYARAALLPLIVIAIFDAPLVSFNQYLLAAMILIPSFKSKLLSKTISGPVLKFSRIIIYVLAILIFGSSVTGHYYYDKMKLDQAIKWDPYHSLYHFSRGALSLNTDAKQSLKDLNRAVELSPDVSFYHGFLASAQLANNQKPAANKTIDRALALDGEEAYWYIIKAFANYSDKKVFDHYFNKAIEAKPQIMDIIQNPQLSADAAITAEGGDARIASFRRRGPDLPLPLPYYQDSK